MPDEGPEEVTAKELLTRAGGAYIPPYRLKQLQAQLNDKSSEDYQRLTWEALKKSVNGLVNKVAIGNIQQMIPEVFGENLVRGRGLFCRFLMKAQMSSPAYTHVYAALISIINTKMPELGELLLKRVILQFRRSYRRNDKPVCIAVTKFIAHLVNQQVAHEILALQLLTLLLEKPTDDSVELSVAFVKEVGASLQDLSPQGAHAIFERFRGILHESEIDKRVQYMIEGLFGVRKKNFEEYPAMLPELDLVEEDDRITHEISLDDEVDPESKHDFFHMDPDFELNEKAYEQIKGEILGDESDEEDDADGSGSGSGSDSDDESSEDEAAPENLGPDGEAEYKPLTEAEKTDLRRKLYLTIMSAASFEECAHKLLKLQLPDEEAIEVVTMILECCSQERSYQRFYGLLGQRLCEVNQAYQEKFEETFALQYGQIHRLETNKLRNVGKLATVATKLQSSVATVHLQSPFAPAGRSITNEFVVTRSILCAPSVHGRTAVDFARVHQTHRGRYNVK